MFYRSVPQWVHKNVLVFDDNTPLAWTDLDLSAVVGKRSALLYIKILNEHVDILTVYFRTNGETAEVCYDSMRASGNNIMSIDAAKFGNVVLETDAAGIIEWYAAFTRNVKIWATGCI